MAHGQAHTMMSGPASQPEMAYMPSSLPTCVGLALVLRIGRLTRTPVGAFHLGGLQHSEADGNPQTGMFSLPLLAGHPPPLGRGVVGLRLPRLGSPYVPPA